MTQMQFGIFTVSDITEDPTTGQTPTERRADPGHPDDRAARGRGRARRLRARRAPQPAVLLLVADHHARLHRREDRAPHPLHRDDPHHHERPGEDRRGLRDAAARRRTAASTSCSGAATPGRCTRGSARTSAQGIPLAIENYALLHRLWREDVVDWQGQFRTPLQGFTSTPRPLDGVRAVRLARQHPQPRDRRAGGLLRRRLLREQHLLAEGALPEADRLLPSALRALRARHRRAGDRRSRRSGVHARAFAGCGRRVPAVLRQRAGLRARPVARGLHRADPAHRGQPAAGHRPLRRRCASTSATTSASCSSWTTPACR